MNILLVSSKKDIASVNLKKSLLKKYNILKENNIFKVDVKNSKNNIFLKEIENMHIFSKEEDILDKSIKFDLVIFLSKHSTLSKIKPNCITVHSVGNWGKAELGGIDETIVKSDGIFIRSLLLKLKKNKPKNIKKYEIKQEATHHGPYLKTPTIFYEIGSCKEDWENKDVSKYMIDCLIDVIKDYDKKKIAIDNNWIEVLGIGGSHYCTKFNRYTFNEDYKYCFKHVIPEYALKNLTENKINTICKGHFFKEKIYEKDI